MRKAAVRFLHPFNHFLFPTKHRSDSGGYFRDESDPAESPQVQAWVARRLAEDYGALFDEFWRSVECGPMPTGPEDVPLRFTWQPGAGAADTAEDEELADPPAPRRDERAEAGATSSLAITPALFESQGEFYEHLFKWEKLVLAWEKDNGTGAPGLRVNGLASGSDASPRVGFVASGFEDARFNQTFCLAGDTQRTAVVRFLRLHEEAQGDARRVFDPGPSQGASLKLYLRVPKGRRLKGWNCLDGTTTGRREQLLARVKKRQ